MERFVEYAVYNNIVLLAPQADIGWSVHNDLRYTGEDNRYFTKQDPQYLAIKNMIEAFAQPHDT